MRLEDLKTGMILKLSDGKFYIVIGNLIVNKINCYTVSNFSCQTFESLTQDLRITGIYESISTEKTSSQVEEILQGKNLRLLERIDKTKKLSFFEAIDKLYQGKAIQSCINSKVYRSLDELEIDKTETCLKEGDWIEYID